jgi:meso-butanediol dehydrogenase / (S,S)-butanediol dehydrogenase / diacetyl reductase
MRLEGKVAIVSGGGTGIGAATARRFTAEGAKVVVMGRRPEPLEAVAAET